MPRRARLWCARPGCRHAPSRHWTPDTACTCGCPAWEDRWPHWWRELAVAAWFGADMHWQEQREEVAIGYATEMAEFALEHPRPTFKRILVGLAGTTGGVPWQHVDP